jgi:predicted amidohydrolase
LRFTELSTTQHFLAGLPNSKYFAWAEPNRFNERFYIKEGPGFPVFNTPKAKIGFVICFDWRFPESFRMIALQGAELEFVPARNQKL